MQEQRKGELFVTADVAIMGAFPVVAVLSYAKLQSIASLAWSSLIAVVVLILVMTWRARWHELRAPLVWRYGIFTGIYIGTLFYGLYYAALQFTTPGNLALLALFQIPMSFIFFNVLHREPFSAAYKVGAILMLAGAIIILARDLQSPNVGDLLVLTADVFAVIGNYYQKKARALCSAETLLFLRTSVAVVALMLLASWLGALAPLASMGAAWPLLLFNGVLGFVVAKMFWVEGIHRMSVTKAMSLVAIGPFLTLFFAWAILAQVPNVWQLLSLAPLVVGVLLLTDQITLPRLG